VEIYLSINNREKVIKFPYLPPELTIVRPQGAETYQTAGGELNLIGPLGLKSVSFESFLDADWAFIEQIELMRRRKLPLRLIVTEAPINIAVTIENFDTTLRRGKKIWYSISFKEFRFLGGVT
jgi:hypothetical protein